MTFRLLKWFIFSVIVGITPILLLVINAAIVGNSVTTESIFGRGDLFLISCLLTASSIGELVGKETLYEKLKLCSIGGGLLVIIGCSYWFASVTTHLISETSYKKDIVALWSMIFFILGLIASTGSIILSKLEYDD